MDNKCIFFIALLPPQDIQNDITEIKEYFATNYHSRKALNSPPHITLQPPFEWSLDQVPILTECLNNFAISHHPISITLQNYAAFPPRVIYIDVIQTPELLNLYSALSSTLENNLNISDPQSKKRPFCPHLTVAFKDLTKANFYTAWEEFAQKKLAFQFIANDITLLIHRDGKWQIHTKFKLSSSGDFL
jgi:2'-5' RNA ligase